MVGAVSVCAPLKTFVRKLSWSLASSTSLRAREKVSLESVAVKSRTSAECAKPSSSRGQRSPVTTTSSWASSSWCPPEDRRANTAGSTSPSSSLSPSNKAWMVPWHARALPSTMVQLSSRTSRAWEGATGLGPLPSHGGRTGAERRWALQMDGPCMLSVDPQMCEVDSGLTLCEMLLEKLPNPLISSADATVAVTVSSASWTTSTEPPSVLAPSVTNIAFRVSTVGRGTHTPPQVRDEAESWHVRAVGGVDAPSAAVKTTEQRMPASSLARAISMRSPAAPSWTAAASCTRLPP
mmetsp:Transcript_131004/g.195231  ORF Transcript_131004/g.195231 Transcript_131004/m.195231 type:complete len:294 (+) Transcript_131004:1307-2188(+)